MSNYISTYFKRVNFHGSNIQEIAFNEEAQTFELRLKESVNTVHNLKKGKLTFNAIITPNKDKEHKKIMILEVSNNVDVTIGDIIDWEDEKWIIFQKERKTRQSFQQFFMIRCNYLIKWIDLEGILRESWCHFSSSLDSKVKENFRTWHSLISPQINKYAEVIMPSMGMERETKIIVEEEAWRVIEYDKSSVLGITYISLGEDKINSIYDDVKEGIADTDQLVEYTMDFPENTQTFTIYEPIELNYTIFKNGEQLSKPLSFIYASSDEKIVEIVDNVPVSKGYGKVTLTLKMVDEPYTEFSREIEIIAASPDMNAFIEGPDIIRLNRTGTYKLKANYPVISSTFTIDNTALATIEKNGAECVIRANDKNKTGTITLSLNYNSILYEKKIDIVPLW